MKPQLYIQNTHLNFCPISDYHQVRSNQRMSFCVLVDKLGVIYWHSMSKWKIDHNPTWTVLKFHNRNTSPGNGFNLKDNEHYKDMVNLQQSYFSKFTNKVIILHSHIPWPKETDWPKSYFCFHLSKLQFFLEYKFAWVKQMWKLEQIWLVLF